MEDTGFRSHSFEYSVPFSSQSLDIYFHIKIGDFELLKYVQLLFITSNFICFRLPELFLDRQEISS
jgi:hypothetical protein